MASFALKHQVVTEDVLYHRVDGVELGATLYRPAGSGPFPGVVSIHGGRWSAENRFTNARIDQALAEAGIVVMAVDFRLAAQARYPLPVADINVAIRWLKDHAADYAIMRGAIGGVGTSSGGHQLMLNALRPHDLNYARYETAGLGTIRSDAKLAYVLVCWAVLDPVARYRYAKAQDMALHVACHEAYFADEAAMHVGSPQRIVADREAECLPPLLLIQGTGDSIVTPDTAERFIITYRAAGGTADLATFEGEPHTFITKKPDAPMSVRAVERMIDFIRLQQR